MEVILAVVELVETTRIVDGTEEEEAQNEYWFDDAVVNIIQGEKAMLIIAKRDGIAERKITRMVEATRIIDGTKEEEEAKSEPWLDDTTVIIIQGDKAMLITAKTDKTAARTTARKSE